MSVTVEDEEGHVVGFAVLDAGALGRVISSIINYNIV